MISFHVPKYDVIVAIDPQDDGTTKLSYQYKSDGPYSKLKFIQNIPITSILDEVELPYGEQGVPLPGSESTSKNVASVYNWAMRHHMNHSKAVIRFPWAGEPLSRDQMQRKIDKAKVEGLIDAPITYRRREDVIFDYDNVMSKVAVTQNNDLCWEWTGKKTDRGYGLYVLSNKPHPRLHFRAHRVVYELLVGPIPDGLTIDHLCENRSCVNPKHLEPVTNSENTIRQRKRQKARKLGQAN